MKIKDAKGVEECQNDKLLSDYQINDKTVIFLDNMQPGMQVEHNYDDNFNFQIDVRYCHS